MTKQKTPILTIEGIIEHLKERRNIEKELKEYEKYTRLISENANDLISIFSDKFEYEYVNEPVHEKVLGYTKGDLIGSSLFRYIHPQDQSKSIIQTYHGIVRRMLYSLKNMILEILPDMNVMTIQLKCHYLKYERL